MVSTDQQPAAPEGAGASLSPVRHVQYQNNVYELIEGSAADVSNAGSDAPKVNMAQDRSTGGGSEHGTVMSLPRRKLTPEELGQLIDDPSILDHIHNLYVRRVARARAAMVTLQELNQRHSSIATQLADAEGEIARSRREALASVEQHHQRLQAELDARYRATVTAVEQEAAARSAPLAGLRAETEHALSEVKRVADVLKGKFREESEAQFIQGFEPVMEDVSGVTSRPLVDLPPAIAHGRAGDFAEAKAHKFVTLCYGHRKARYPSDAAAVAAAAVVDGGLRRQLKTAAKREQLRELRQMVERSQVERGMARALSLDTASEASASDGGRARGRSGSGAAGKGSAGGARRRGREESEPGGSEYTDDGAANPVAEARREIEALVEWTRNNPPPAPAGSSQRGGASSAAAS